MPTEMPTPLDHSEWHTKNWRIQGIHNNPRIGNGDSVSFSMETNNEITIGVSCANPNNAQYWNGVISTKNSSNSKKGAGATKPVSPHNATAFTITSSLNGSKTRLTCEIVRSLDLDDPGSTGVGACWIADEQP